jgi:hypothetical protein
MRVGGRLPDTLEMLLGDWRRRDSDSVQDRGHGALPMNIRVLRQALQAAEHALSACASPASSDASPSEICAGCLLHMFAAARAQLAAAVGRL